MNNKVKNLGKYAKKGNIPWNKGTKGICKTNSGSFVKGQKLSAETKRRISEAVKGKIPWIKGKHHTEEEKKRVSLALKGRPKSQEWKIKISKALTGKKRPEISREKNWNWAGGISFLNYPSEFNSLLKLKIRTRDNFTCCLCGRTEREELEELNRVLSVNHINFDKNDCREENLNTLCLRCNVKINRERDYWTNYFNTKI